MAAPGDERGRGGVTPQRWKQVETVFEQALEVSAAERASFLQSSCAGDDELRREVESMLRSHDAAGSFLDERDDFFSSEDWPENRVLPGERIDRYRIIREIGRGGMGAVFLAERADEQY